MQQTVTDFQLTAITLRMLSQLVIIPLVLAVSITSIHSMPIDKKARRSDSSSLITIPQSVMDILIDVNIGDTPTGLLGVHLTALNLSDDKLFEV